ncbi:MAG: formylglycine-generating enzyme family protein [Planctomycetota bacterium]|nr:formylglycine-generating enzyme family protein [Planctomycetota bacterium]
MRSLVLSIVLLVASPVFGQQPKAITNSIGMKLALILPGSFWMGSPKEEKGRLSNETQHLVTISHWFYIGAYEVTQDQYEKVMGSNPSRFKGAKNPVETVGWDDAVSFCKKLSAMPEEKAAGREYRLPTEAEWEYACRANSISTYSFGDSAESLGESAWYDQNAGLTTHPVGEKKPNRWGLYDMHGNVWERCQDWNADYPSDASTDPKGPDGGSIRVARGGCWSGVAAFCRSAIRAADGQSIRSGQCGIRIALSPSVRSPESDGNNEYK